MAKSRTSFQPGQSGNSKGREPGHSVKEDLKVLAKKKTGLAIRTLEDICRLSKDDRARFMAAKELLDRGYGKVKEQQIAPHQNLFVELLKQMKDIQQNGYQPISGPAIIDLDATPPGRIGVRDETLGGGPGELATRSPESGLNS